MATSKIQNDYGMLKPFVLEQTLSYTGTTSASVTIDGYTMMYVAIGNGSSADYGREFIPLSILKQRAGKSQIIYDGVDADTATKYLVLQYNSSTQKVDAILYGTNVAANIYLA